ncbi:helix-turn-helix domain-containing protein [Francisella marina]|uniref:helix-turn-helix domain-containing protein n=1 Tax=Francisella marina TaxID=2249302 RepID=UPI0011EE4C66|nr:helix-turn-helix domain-containing protein [Francisella marina]QEO58299.1 helix-turn-helix domain-containing protein [Francisella marina]
MSIEALDWAFNQDVKQSSAKLVLLSLANYANDDGVSYPSWATLEERCTSSRKTIYRSIKNLKELGLIEEVSTDYIPKKYFKNQNCYRLVFDSVKITPVSKLHQCQNDPDTSVKMTKNTSVKMTPKYKEQFNKPSLNDVISFIVSKGYSEDLANIVYETYDSNDWKDSHNNVIKNWKLKIVNNWLSKEHNDKYKINQNVKPIDLNNLRRYRFTTNQAFEKFNDLHDNKFILVEDGYIRLKGSI